MPPALPSRSSNFRPCVSAFRAPGEGARGAFLLSKSALFLSEESAFCTCRGGLPDPGSAGRAAFASQCRKRRQFRQMREQDVGPDAVAGCAGAQPDGIHPRPVCGKNASRGVLNHGADIRLQPEQCRRTQEDLRIRLGGSYHGAVRHGVKSLLQLCALQDQPGVAAGRADCQP